ncbi:hypothetical protein AB7M16_006592 [Bradyrhizobium sp. USDA 372]
MIDDIRADQAAYIQIRMAMHKIENRTEDGTLIVLKGHLVLEELIRAKVEAAVHDPTALRKANLTFFNLLCVARALYGPLPDRAHENPHDLWDVVEAWNTLRNRLAHRIEPTDIAPFLARIFFWAPADWRHNLEDEETQSGLSIAIGMLIGGIGRLVPPRSG